MEGREIGGSTSLVQREANELRQNFEQIKRLLDFAAQKLDPDNSFDAYVGRIKQNKQVPKLPSALKGVVAAYPGEYFVVHYVDRNSPHNAEGTRGRTVGLSTAEKRSQSDERVREIIFHEPGADERDPHMYMTVREMVNEKSFLSINEAGENEIERPHGQALVTYALSPDGRKEAGESSFSRLDEGIFEWRGEQQPVRWNRKLQVMNIPEETLWRYDDLYIIGRDQKGKSDERAQVKTEIRGSLENPVSIRVEVGIGGGFVGTMIYKDSTLEVFINNPFGSHRNEAEILAMDPNYAFLVQGKEVDKERLLSVIRSKVRMLMEDWDKPHPVFGQMIEDGRMKEFP